jgi:hypothetical protein
MGANSSTLSKSELKKIAIEHQIPLETTISLYGHYTQLVQRDIQTTHPWIVEKVFDTFVPQHDFKAFLKMWNQWSNASVEVRLDMLFSVLDYDGDGSLTPSDIAVFVANAEPIQVGERVRLRHDPRYGICQYVGKTEFAQGTWVGMELDPTCGQTGKNSGSIDGVEYFQTENEGMGIFVQFHTVEREVDYLRGKAILEAFGVGSSVSREVFLEKCQQDAWILKRLS